MAKFKIEVELDSLNEDEGIDEVLRDEIASSIKSTITQNATKQVMGKLNKTIGKLSESITERANEEADKFLGETFSKRIEEMKIPYKKDSWSSNVEFMPLGEFVGKRYEEFLNKKVFDQNGCIPRYDSDKKLSVNEYLINKYLEKELGAKVNKLIQNARKEAEDTIIKTLEENLRTQLSVDIIKRLNIPNLLKSLQEKALLLKESDTEK
jgi:hypothetical protein